MPEREVCSVPEREAWSACAGKGGLECMCRKGTLRVRVPEREFGVRVPEMEALSACRGI